MRIGNKAACELLDIIDIVNFGERIPFERARLERVQHDVAAVTIEESSSITAIGIGEYGAVAAFERPGQEIADGRGLSRSRGPQNLEVLGLITRPHGDTGKR